MLRISKRISLMPNDLLACLTIRDILLSCNSQQHYLLSLQTFHKVLATCFSNLSHAHLEKQKAPIPAAYHSLTHANLILPHHSETASIDYSLYSDHFCMNCLQLCIMHRGSWIYAYGSQYLPWQIYKFFVRASACHDCSNSSSFSYFSRVTFNHAG